MTNKKVFGLSDTHAKVGNLEKCIKSKILFILQQITKEEQRISFNQEVCQH